METGVGLNRALAQCRPVPSLCTRMLWCFTTITTRRTRQGILTGCLSDGKLLTQNRLQKLVTTRLFYGRSPRLLCMTVLITRTGLNIHPC